MSEERAWLDLSGLGLRLTLATAPSGTDYQLVDVTPDRKDLDGPTGQDSLHLLDLGFQRSVSDFDGRHRYFRPDKARTGSCRGVDDLARAFPGSVPRPFVAETDGTMRPRVEPGRDPGTPAAVLHRKLSELARFASRNGLDIEAALREAMAPLQETHEPGTSPPGP